MAPSRRRFLELSGLTLAGSLGSVFAVSGAESGSTSAYDWPMARYDPAGTGHHPAASGPKDGVQVVWTHDTTDWFRGTAPPIRQADTIYAAGNGLLALNSTTGARQFGHPGPYQSSPARAQASVYDTATLATEQRYSVRELTTTHGGIPPRTADLDSNRGQRCPQGGHRAGIIVQGTRSRAHNPVSVRPVLSGPD